MWATTNTLCVSPAERPSASLLTRKSIREDRRFHMNYEYMVKTKGLSMLASIEDFGRNMEKMLNEDANAHNELGWELFQVQVLSDVEVGGNNGLVYVYRRPKP
jgi:hypothetical protein